MAQSKRGSKEEKLPQAAEHKVYEDRLPLKNRVVALPVCALMGESLAGPNLRAGLTNLLASPSGRLGPAHAYSIVHPGQNAVLVSREREHP
jgi:hypothetical protein